MENVQLCLHSTLFQNVFLVSDATLADSSYYDTCMASIKKRLAKLK